MRYLVVDLETTGLDLVHDSIVSYGAVTIHAGRIQAAQDLYGLVRPQSQMNPEAVAVHAIRPADLVDAPPLSHAVSALEPRLADAVLVAHAAWIERSFLSRAFRQYTKRLRSSIIDTAALARAAGIVAGEGRIEPNLEELAHTLKLPVVSPHHALGDAVTTANVFLALATKLEAAGHRRAADLVQITARDATRSR